MIFPRFKATAVACEIALSAFFMLGVEAAFSAEKALDLPQDAILLTILGQIKIPNRGGTAVFDRTKLESLGVERVTTSTPWHDGPQVFEGVPLEKLLKSVGAVGDTVEAVALNNYVVDIPRSDLAKYNVILASKRNGEPMSVREKGPLFIIYPFDSLPELSNPIFQARCAWQVYKIVVK